jgi:hypothetical protein
VKPRSLPSKVCYFGDDPAFTPMCVSPDVEINRSS